MSPLTTPTVLDPSDTIVAIASRPGPAARGVVRLSGPASIAIASDGFEPILPPIARPSAWEGRLGLGPPLGDLPATLVLWPGPRSYTGQAVAEVHAVGSPPILRHLVDRSLARGARLAEPGEFTLRAFLSGRIDLDQAEAVLGLIRATSPRQLDAALRRLAGGLAGPIRSLRDGLLDRLVELEANLDFVEESDVAPVVRRGLVDDLVAASAHLDHLIARRHDRDRSESSPRVVLAGRPNAGKSRLFNALIGRDRAIVSPFAGTTRDDLVGHLDCDGLPIELVDTAGEDVADSAIGVAAQARRERQVAGADLVLLCVPADEEETAIGDDDRTLVVTTKADLRPGARGLAVSAATGVGVDRLRSAIGEELRGRAVAADSAEGLGSAWTEGLGRAAESLDAALLIASNDGGDELIAAELRRAIDDLGAIVGAVVSEDILDRIFRRFCVGK